ncbi:hypothetical protein [Rhizobium sp. NPDC090279]|uniref:hypothetical protein n=1 Tax=Rhizobium sp. NPDC090279 TaxID=3364499 RepID=UPI00383BB71E
METPWFLVVATCLLAANPSIEGEAQAAQQTNAGNHPIPQIWFNMGAISTPVGHHSWDLLYYQPNPEWPSFMGRVKVVGMITQALVKIPDADLAKMAARLKQEHVALGIEMLAQAYTLPGAASNLHCGGGIEGYLPPEQTAALAAKLKRAGADLQYLAMDEPLWFGHYYSGKNACRSSIEDVAERVALNIREYQKVFPHVALGEMEPFPSITDQPHWQDDYREWQHAIHVKTGQPLAFTFVDINWGIQRWPASLQAFEKFSHTFQQPFGIIYNAAPPHAADTNQQWLDDAQRNFIHIEKTLGVEPDWAMFTSWDRFPGHAITDQSGPGEDYLVKGYLRFRGEK